MKNIKTKVLGLITGMLFAVAVIMIGSTFTQKSEEAIIVNKPTTEAQPINVKQKAFDIEDTSSTNNTYEKKADLKTEPITLKKIFDDKLEILTEDSIAIVTTGDYIPGRSVNYLSVTDNNFTWTVNETAELLNSADITLINMEAPLTKECPLTNEGFIFCGDQKHIEAIKMAGVDVVNLANNHTLNYGLEGLNETLDLLEENNINHSGVGDISYVTVGNITFAFVGYNVIGASYEPISDADPDLMKKQIKEAKETADVVVVSMQWGVEYTEELTENQKELSHFLIDNGADLVVGNHPHWIQPIEIYKDKMIVYAHGNYVFDQMWSEETKEGIVVTYSYNGKELVDAKITPIYISDYGKSTVANEEKTKRILANLEQISLNLDN